MYINLRRQKSDFSKIKQIVSELLDSVSNILNIYLYINLCIDIKYINICYFIYYIIYYIVHKYYI